VESPLVGWRGNWAGSTAVVMGSGEVGFAIADTCHELGAHTLLVTDTPSTDREKILQVLGVELVDDRDSTDILPAGLTPDFVVLSHPSFRSHPLAVSLSERGVPVWSELEFSFRVADKSGTRPRLVMVACPPDQAPSGIDPWTLATQLLVEAGIRAVVVGRRGVVALDVFRDPTPWEVVVWPLEASELDDLNADVDPERSPFVAVADDTVSDGALDALYHRTALACVYTRSGGASEQAVERAWVLEGARAIGVGLDSPGMSDLGVVEGIVCDRAFLDDRRDRALEVTTLEELAALQVVSPEQVTQVMQALAIARAFGVDQDLIGQVLRSVAP